MPLKFFGFRKTKTVGLFYDFCRSFRDAFRSTFENKTETDYTTRAFTTSEVDFSINIRDRTRVCTRRQLRRLKRI